MAVATLTPENARWLRLASTASVVTALLLIGLKAWAWWVSDSVALMASLIDSVMDSASSIINFIAIRYALMPADEEHRFGHGKAEALSGLGQAAFIAGSAVFLLMHATERLFNPAPVTDTSIGIAVMVISIAATAVLVLIQRIAIRKTGSTAVKADSLHYVGDLLVNASIIVALVLATAGYYSADAWFGIAIAFYIAWNAWEILKEAFNHLLDREVSEDVRAEILRLVESRPGVTGVHDLRTRLSGQHMFVQLHLEIARDTPLWRAHEIAEDVELAILTHYPHSEVIVHQDPTPLEEAGAA